MKLRQFQGMDLEFVIDIGANIGIVTHFIKALFPKTKVICVEPEPTTFECLNKNTSFVPGVYLENKAFGTGENCQMIERGTRYMAKYTVECNSGSVEGITLKDIFTKYDISFNSKYFIKSDCEGSEKYFMGDKFCELAIENADIFFLEVHFSASGCCNEDGTPIFETEWQTYDDWLHKRFAFTHKIEYFRSNRKGGYGHYLLTKISFHSSIGQDRWVLKTLHNKTDGYFVDVGASDGISHSNSYALEKRGWTGICVEPNPLPRAFQKLSDERNCICENVCIYNANTEVDFIARGRRIEGSGIVGYIEKPGHPIIKVPAITLMQLLDQNNAPSIIDYLSLDTEGAEWEILKNFDFSKYTFLTMTIENNYNERRQRESPKKEAQKKWRRDEIRNLLDKNGYVLKKSVNFGEDWFVRKQPLKYDFWDGKFRNAVKKEHKITFITTCMGRLYNLKDTLPVNIKDNADYKNLEFLVLDYNSDDNLGDWMKENMSEEMASGRVSYYRTKEPTEFSMAHSRNIAFKLATGDIVNNLDADNFTINQHGNPIKECWAAYLNRMANEQNERVIFAKGKTGMRGRIGFFKQEFIDLLGGYDENLLGYGHDDHDLVYRAWELGFTMYWWGGQYYHRIKTARQEKDTNLARPWKVTEKENKIKSAKNLEEGRFKANEGIHWGKAKLIKNFSEEIEI